MPISIIILLFRCSILLKNEKIKKFHVRQLVAGKHVACAFDGINAAWLIF